MTWNVLLVNYATHCKSDIWFTYNDLSDISEHQNSNVTVYKQFVQK